MAKQPIEKRLEFIEHTDGRIWLRADGKIIWEAPQKSVTPEDLATQLYRKIGGTIARVAERLNDAAKNPIVHSHPQFVRPYDSGVMEYSGKAIHHKDGNPRNNDPANLEVVNI